MHGICHRTPFIYVKLMWNGVAFYTLEPKASIRKEMKRMHFNIFAFYFTKKNHIIYYMHYKYSGKSTQMLDPID